jgi:hypothetical protein
MIVLYLKTHKSDWGEGMVKALLGVLNVLFFAATSAAVVLALRLL